MYVLKDAFSVQCRVVFVAWQNIVSSINLVFTLILVEGSKTIYSKHLLKYYIYLGLTIFKTSLVTLVTVERVASCLLKVF